MPCLCVSYLQHERSLDYVDSAQIFVADDEPFPGQAYMPLTRFHAESIFSKNCHRYSFKEIDPITTQLYTYQDSLAVLVCVQLRCDWIYMKVNVNQCIVF